MIPHRPVRASQRRFLAAALAILAIPAFAAADQAAIQVVEQLVVTGTVESVAGGRLTVVDPAGIRHEIRVQPPGEPGVTLADGRLLACPAEVRVTGGFDPARLEPGQVVRLETRLNIQGKAAGELASITVVDAAGAAIGVQAAVEPERPADFTDCTVTAAVKSAGRGRLVVELPKDKAWHRKTTLTFKVAADSQARLESGDPRQIAPGSKLVRAEAMRFDSGDLVARVLVVETTLADVKPQGDDALARKHRSVSDEPRTEPRLVRSAHFAFLTDISDREAKILMDKLERMAGLLERYFGRRPAGVVEGFVVRDMAAFPAGTLVEDEGVAKIRAGAGVCFNTRLGKQRKAILYACADHGVIQHECTHGFCHMTFGSTGPTWLSEGVAEMGNYWKDDAAAVDIDPAVMAYLRRAEPKRGLLEIAVPGQVPAGTWQDYAWRWALCHMLASNPNYADRFKPLAIDLMEGRPGVSFESVYGPVAREVAFEYGQFLETVGNGYRADLVAWPWQARYRRLADAGRVTTTVKAQAGWQASGLAVEQAVTYAVEAEGTWQTAAAGEPCSAAGDAGGCGRLQGAVLVETEQGFRLSAAIPLGPQATFTAPAAGRLVLRCTDDWTQLADNEGKITVTLRRSSE